MPGQDHSPEYLVLSIPFVDNVWYTYSDGYDRGEGKSAPGAQEFIAGGYRATLRLAPMLYQSRRKRTHNSFARNAQQIGAGITDPHVPVLLPGK